MKRTRANSPALRWLAAGVGRRRLVRYARRFHLVALRKSPSPKMDEADRLLDKFKASGR